MKVIKQRIYIIILLIFISMLVLIIRLGYVQIVKGTVFLERAYDLWTREIPVDGQRGKIYDRNGKLIVGNTLAPTVAIIPKQVKTKNMP